MAKKDTLKISRRQLLLSAGAAAGAVATSGLPGTALGAGEAPHWDMTADVVVVGSGAAASSAAVTAAATGASVIVVEKMPLTGGTAAKSGGVAWIPNNHLMRAQGQEDNRDDCLRYMARYTYPDIYDPNSKTLGLPEANFELLAAFYDNGSKMIELFEKIDAAKFKQFKMWTANALPRDYGDYLPENKASSGRSLEIAGADASTGASFTGGRILVQQMEQFLQKRKVPILVEHRAVGLIRDSDKVIGLEVKNEDKLLRIQARKGVIFGTGGFAHNLDLLRLHQPSISSIYGSCAVPSSTGDFIEIAQQAGAKMGFMGSAWRSPVILDQALQNRIVPACVWIVPGDSMIHVNKYGKRVVNEKCNDNDKTRVHFAFDPENAEYPNRFLFVVFDDRTLSRYAGVPPLPADKRESTWLIEGNNSQELTQNIKKRLDSMAGKIGDYALADNFAANLDATIERFNKFAEAGRDEDFERGLHSHDRVWMAVSPVNEDTKYPANDKPNITMYPIDRSGPLYAVILAPGALDTSGGPAINANGQVLSAAGPPIPGLYGAGNCIAAPTRQTYMGAGGTIGPALTFGYIAARHAIGQES